MSNSKVKQPEYSKSILRGMKEKYNILDDDFSYILVHAQIIALIEQDKEMIDFIKWQTGSEKFISTDTWKIVRKAKEIQEKLKEKPKHNYNY